MVEKEKSIRENMHSAVCLNVVFAVVRSPEEIGTQALSIKKQYGNVLMQLKMERSTVQIVKGLKKKL